MLVPVLVVLVLVGAFPLAKVAAAILAFIWTVQALRGLYEVLK